MIETNNDFRQLYQFGLISLETFDTNNLNDFDYLIQIICFIWSILFKLFVYVTDSLHIFYKKFDTNI